MRGVVRIILCCVLVSFVCTVQSVAQNGLLDGKLVLAPHYSSETGFGSAVAYNTGKGVVFIGNVASEGYVLLGVTGAHYTKNKKWRIKHNTYYNYSPLYFWGAGYVSGSSNSNRRKYNGQQFLAQGEFMYCPNDNFYFGPTAGYGYINWKEYGDSWSLFNCGFIVGYDSRDIQESASRGICAVLKQTNYSNWSGNASLQFDFYREVWNGGVMAFDAYSVFSYGRIPVALLPSIGGPYRMRGYYKGRYRDKHAVMGQLELRQHIWEIIGATAWIGAANVWGYNKFSIRHSLPNFGLGLRIKAAENVNFRFDYGFGKDGQNCFIFSLNEAF